MLEPRQGNETADRAMVSEVKLCKWLVIVIRPLRCLIDHEGNSYVVDGIFCLHVDDILSAGEGVRCKEDAREPHGEPTCYAERLYVLLHRFRFGSVDDNDK